MTCRPIGFETSHTHRRLRYASVQSPESLCNDGNVFHFLQRKESKGYSFIVRIGLVVRKVFSRIISSPFGNAQDFLITCALINELDPGCSLR